MQDVVVHPDEPDLTPRSPDMPQALWSLDPDDDADADSHDTADGKIPLPTEPDLEPQPPVITGDPLEHRLVSTQVAIFAVAAAILIVFGWAGLGFIDLLTAKPSPSPTTAVATPGPSGVTPSRAPSPTAAAPTPGTSAPAPSASPTAPSVEEVAIERGERLDARWRRIAAAPIAGRTDHVAVWTGTEMLVWGGIAASGPVNDGAAYDPVRNRWRAIRDSPVPGRPGAAFAWSGSELYVWGGNRRRDGGRFDPEANRWRRLPASGLIGAPSSVGAWTAAGFVVVTSRPQAAIYDPDTNAWRIVEPPPPLPAGRMSAAVLAGLVYVVAEGDSTVAPLRAAVFDPAARTWQSLPDAPIDGPFAGLHLVAAGGQLLVGSARFDPATGAWTRLVGSACPVVTGPVAVTPRLVLANRFAIDLAGRTCNPIRTPLPRPIDGQPAERIAPSSVWTGRDWILWSGGTGRTGDIPADGIALRPADP